MSRYPKEALVTLCQRLQIETEFFEACIEESVIELHESDGQLVVGNGTTLQLRKLERLCQTFHIDVPTAILLRDLRQRVAELEEEIKQLRRS